MQTTAVCQECGQSFDSGDLEDGHCEPCGDSLEAAGRAAMDPDGNGYDRNGVWDPERLGF